jgi:hypothetical protein
MSGTLSATTASALAPYLNAATGVAGLGSTAYNFYNQYKNQQYQDLLRSYAQNPQKMNQYAAGFTQPLNAGLTTSVANNAQAYLAQRGLSDSPQISQQVESQAIAPYIQQNQQAGYQDALQALNLGGGAIPPQIQAASGLSALTKAFSQLNPAGSPAASVPPALLDYLRTFGTQAPTIDPNQWNYGPEPTTPIDTSSWGGDTTPDMSSFYTPDYSSSGS